MIASQDKTWELRNKTTLDTQFFNIFKFLEAKNKYEIVDNVLSIKLKKCLLKCSSLAINCINILKHKQVNPK